jgi:hypothetical protein
MIIHQIIKWFAAKPAFDSGLRLEFYVPNRRQDGSELLEQEHRTWIALISRAVAEAAGGVTVTDSTGMWIHQEDGALVREKTAVISAFIDSRALQLHYKRLRSILYQFGKECEQEAVLFVVNNEPFFINPKNPY